uniref:Uncharacterized protein n=1 Tax=Amphimedon queenslandica TaxID=400682 RepID=A0A1X7TMD1_AMPQE
VNKRTQPSQLREVYAVNPTRLLQYWPYHLSQKRNSCQQVTITMMRYRHYDDEISAEP